MQASPLSFFLKGKPYKNFDEFIWAHIPFVLELTIGLSTVHFFQGMFQEVTQSSMLQHNAIYIQHGYYDEGKSEHSFFISDEA